MKICDLFIESYEENNDLPYIEEKTYKCIFYQEDSKHVKMLEIVKMCGKGAYGIVYKCIYNHNIVCAIKFSSTECPFMLKKRYDGLYKDFGNDIMVKIILSGKIINEGFPYKYYSLMEYGGISLKKYISFGLDCSEMNHVVMQIVHICEKIYKHKHLITDFKLSNLTISETKKRVVKIIDIYMESSNYETFENCKYFKTINIIDINICKIYKDTNYTFNYIYTLMAFMLIDMLCINKLSHITNEISIKINDKNESYKKILVLIQLSFYVKKKDYVNKKIDKYIKKITNSHLFETIYETFINEIVIRKKYQNIINTNKFIDFLNVVISPGNKSINIYDFFIF